MAVNSPEIHRRLFPAGQVRELDRITIEEKGVAGIELMERAGRAAWEELISAWPGAERIAVVCGAGNNAGDGYIIALCGIENGKKISLVALTDPESLRGDALLAARKYRATGEKIHRSLAEVRLDDMDVIVDAILGTGLDRAVEGGYLEAIHAINGVDVPVLSVDVPSGLHADSGLPMGAAIRADMTVTFIGRKTGLYIGEGANYRGNVSFNDLDVPRDVYDRVDFSAELIDISHYRELLKRRSRTGHKGNYGHVLVVGGEYGFAGAVSMCGVAAARTGAGLVSIATRSEHAFAIPASRPELMASAVRDISDLKPVLSRATVVAAGPGLGQTDWSRALLSCVLETGMPMVIDADGLNLLAQDPEKRDNWILTPHPGEAARLLDCEVKTVQTDRLSAAAALRDRYGGIIVLKGAGTIISGKSVSVCPDGNPGMATGGMGDLLTGVIAGLLAQGLAPEDAAGLGVCLHARAADLNALKYGERGMLAGDLLPCIRQLVNLRECG